MDAEVAEAIRELRHEVRNKMAAKFGQVDVNTATLAELKKLVMDHVATCDSNKSDILMVTKAVNDLRGTMRVAGWVQKTIVGGATLVGAIYGAWKMFKGG